MDTTEPGESAPPSGHPPIRLVDGLFELAATITDEIGRRPYTTEGGKPSPPKVRALFGINPSAISLWRTEGLDRDGPEAPLTFTEKLIEIFSGKYKAHVAQGDLEEADLVYRFWQSDCGDYLKKVTEVLEQYAQALERRSAANARAQTLAQLATEVTTVAQHEPSPGESDFLPKVQALDANFASRGYALKILPKQLVPPETRKDLFLRRPDWDLVCRDAYVRRDDFLKQLCERFDVFLSKRKTVINQLKLPVFWIGGRSGDGKSVLLLQLAREILSVPNAPVTFWCNSPDDLIEMLGQTSAALPDQLILAVDDLHKALDWDAALSAFERAANRQRDLVLLTCGPTPERTSFLRDKKNLVALFPSDAPNLTEADAASLTKHFGVEIHASNEKRPTLVEQLYFGMGGEPDLTVFARSLQRRLDLPVGQQGLLAQLTAFSWMDVPFPADLLDPVAQSRIEELAGDTQLHFERVPDGYRFGHPAIAKPIFDGLTTVPNTTLQLAVRLAKTLLPVLQRMDAAARRRALRQVAPRLAKDGDLSPFEVLVMLFRFSSGVGLAGDIAIEILGQLRTGIDVEKTEWLRVARTLRDNNSVEGRIRAQLAGELALREPMDERDFRAALELVKGSQTGPYLGAMIKDLLARSKRNIRQRLLSYATNWAERNVDQREWQNVLLLLLNNFPNDRRVRAIVRNLLSSPNLGDTKSAILASAAKYMEEESEELLRRWLRQPGAKRQAGPVLLNLLSRPGSLWVEPAIGWLGQASSIENPDWANVVGRILQRVEPEHRFVSQAKIWAKDLEAHEAAGVIFESLAKRASDFDAVELVERRLALRWGRRDAIGVFRSLWTSLSEVDDATKQRLADVAAWSTITEDKSDNGQLVSAKMATDAAQALSDISGDMNKPQHWAPLCMNYLRLQPQGGVAGKIVGSLLTLWASMRTGHARVMLSEVVEAEEFLLTTAWNIVEDQGQAGGNRANALVGLIRACYQTELRRIKDAISTFFYPQVVSSAHFVLGVWLSAPESRADALTFLLDNSVIEERRFEIRARAAARNLPVILEELRRSDISARNEMELCQLLQHGVGDYERSPDAALAAWERKAMWSETAAPFLWRGILRSSIGGFTMRRDFYWKEFELWFRKTNDVQCKSILEAAGLLSQ
jgi:hypothetical protein